MNGHYWCDWRSTPVVANLVLCKFNFLTKFSADFGRQVLKWETMQYHIILWRNLYAFYENTDILSKKEFYVSDSWKNISLMQTNFGKLWNKVPIHQWFSNFTSRFYYYKIASKSLIFKISFSEKMGVLWPPLNFFSIYIIYYSILMKFCIKHLYMIVSYK